MSRPKGVKDSIKRKFREPKVSLSLVGKRIGRWTVLEFIQGKNRDIKFRVLCDCGTEVIRTFSTIAYGKSLSCGCLHKEQLIKRITKQIGHSAKNKVLTSYKQSCKQRNLDFILEEELFFSLISKNCYYCGKEPQQKVETKTGIIIYNGLDRVDNNFGYIPSNVVPCCISCNKIKHYVTKEIILKAAEFLNGS